MCTMVETLDEAPAELGRRERKKRARRLALKAAALDLVAERGYTNVTVEDIAEAADVSVRTFFNYFPSKDAAIVGQDPESIESMRAELIALPADMTPLDAFRTTMVSRIRAVGADFDESGDDHITWLRRFEVVRAQPEVLSAFTKQIATLEAALSEALLVRLGGDESLRPYTSIVTACAMGVMRSATTCQAKENGTEAVVEAVEAGFRLLATGFDLDLAAVITGDHMTPRSAAL